MAVMTTEGRSLDTRVARAGSRAPGFWRRTTVWRVARLVAGVAVLAAVAARVGTGPFLRGLLSIDLGSVLAAAALMAVATAAAAWRWRVVTGRLGAPLSMHAALGMYYRSAFLNAILPLGVLGDVHRAVAHGRVVAVDGREPNGVPTTARAVAIERLAGQATQLVATLAVLGVAVGLVGGESVPALALTVLSWLGIAALAGATALTAVCASSRRARRWVRGEVVGIRLAMGSAWALAQVVIASLVAVGCYVAVFVVAAAGVGLGRAATGTHPVALLVVALVVLLAATLPLNIGGWGPREGAAGWAFAAAGLSASAGVAAATAFGVLTLIAVAPGAVVALVGWLRPSAGPWCDTPSRERTTR